jgi:hypothetical protein
MICRIQTRIPIPLEKFEFMPQLGQFTLRDEGKTIAVGKVLRYKPAKDVIATGAGAVKGKEETKGIVAGAAKVEELVYDMDTGETISREEYSKRVRDRDLA